jgi:phosphoserine phosphatase
MQVIHASKIIFVDCDDTLVIWDRSSYTPHQEHIDAVKRFHARGHTVVVWSAGGSEWAERVVKELHLEPYITLVMSKPDWYIDDKSASEFMPENVRIYYPSGDAK